MFFRENIVFLTIFFLILMYIVRKNSDNIETMWLLYFEKYNSINLNISLK